MSDQNILKVFLAEDLAPTDEPIRPEAGDLVEFWLQDETAGVRGHVVAVYESRQIKVRVSDIGSFLVPIDMVRVLSRSGSSPDASTARLLSPSDVSPGHRTAILSEEADHG